LLMALATGLTLTAQTRPRILVSTDIGGTDPDDNQSMIHLLMYADDFDIEGLVSSPSFGDGSRAEICRMIDLYARDFPRLQARGGYFPEPERLKSITKQGRHGAAPLSGYDVPTEGSEWIVRCARREDSRPLWVLVWGALEDVAQALHDAPDIAGRIRVYWIGGPNKKWGVNAYNYVAENFPDLWMIENNASYRGLIGDGKDSTHYQAAYWTDVMKGHGAMGDDFKNYYGGVVKMGDTPSLLYLMGNSDENVAARKGLKFSPDEPQSDHWGGRFEPMTLSPRYVVTGALTVGDTVPTYAVMEWRLRGPLQDDRRFPRDSVCFTLHIDRQTWDGRYNGDGIYVVRYAPKAPAVLRYAITSPLADFPVHEGTFVVGRQWPGIGTYGTASSTISERHIRVGNTWFTDCEDRWPECAGRSDEGRRKSGEQWQGASTVARWRNDVLDDWARRFAWLAAGDVNRQEEQQ